MNYKKILYATDFSPASQAALEYASSLARDSGAMLIILHVEETMVPYGTGDQIYYTTPTHGSPVVRQMLEAVVPSDRAVRYEHRHLLGAAADEIVRLASEEQVDLIVIGTHGRSGISRILMGSVAEAVMRHATCPVLTLKHGAHAVAESK